METIHEMSGCGMLSFVLSHCQLIRCVGASHSNASLGQAKLDANGHTRVEKLNGAGKGAANRASDISLRSGSLTAGIGRSHLPSWRIAVEISDLSCLGF